MAITYVGGKTASTVGITTSWNISLTNLTGGTGSAPQTGDLVIIGYQVGTTGGDNYNEQIVTSGYIRHQDLFESESTFNSNLAVYYKFMGGTPDTSVDMPETGTLARAGAVTIQVFRGVASSIFDVTTTTAQSDNYGRPDPASITPSSPESLIVVVGGASHDSIFTNSQLSNFISTTGTDTYSASIGSGTYTWTSGSFNPSEYGGGSISALYAWCAVTMALRPAGYDVTVSETTTLTDTNDAFIGQFALGYDSVEISETSGANGGVSFDAEDTVIMTETMARVLIKWFEEAKNSSIWTNIEK